MGVVAPAGVRRHTINHAVASLIGDKSRAATTEGPEDKSFFSGGEGGIRTHVPELPDHPISSRRRYDRFGTCPREIFKIRATPRGARILAERC